MKRMCVFSLCAVCAGVLGVLLFADSASAYYHPSLGRWMSRDPGAGGGDATRLGGGGAVGGGFLPRDPTEQHADGMSLYEYVLSGPTIARDSSGLSVDCDVVIKQIDVRIYRDKKGNIKISFGHRWIKYPGHEMGFYPAEGESYWWGKGETHWNYSGKPDRTWPTPKTDVFYRWLKAGPKAEAGSVCCSEATCQDVYDCMKAVGDDWNGTLFSVLIGRNCRAFVRDVAKKCCLELPVVLLVEGM